jgi:hypothetical protein
MKSSAVTFHVTPFGYLGVLVLEVLIASVPKVFDRPFMPGAEQSYIGSGSTAGSAMQYAISGGCGSRMAHLLVVCVYWYT